MRPVVSLTTALAFLLHLWLGCCTHHAHASDTVTPCSAAKTGRCHHHGHASHKHDAPSKSDKAPAKKECPPGSCDGAHCSFTTVGKTFETKAWFAPVNCIAVLTPAFIFQPLLSFDADLGGDLDFAPPVRAHLLNQILLI